MAKQFTFSSFSALSSVQDDSIYTAQSKYLYALNKNQLTQAEGFAANSSPLTKSATTRHFAIVLKDKKDVTIDGNGSRIMLKDKGSYAFLQNCENVTIKNFTFDVETPYCPQFTVLKTGLTSATVKFAANTGIKKEGDGFFLVCGDTTIKTDGNGITYIHDPKTDSNVMMSFGKEQTKDVFSNVVKSDILEDGANQTVKFTFRSLCPLKSGCTYFYRTNERDEVGFLLDNCKNVTIESCNIKYMHTQGIVAQFCENVTLLKLDVRPKANYSVSCTGNAADFYACNGDIKVSGCYFSGCLGKIINMNAQYLKVDSVSGDNVIYCSYKNPKYYGLPYCKSGDTVAFVDPATLSASGRYGVSCCETDALSADVVKITLDDSAPENATSYVLENLSVNNANLLFENNVLYDTPNRGICINAKGSHKIYSNNFKKVSKSAIWCGGDASSSFVCGTVTGLDICSNRFSDCHSPVIEVSPYVADTANDVHESVTLSKNQFHECEKLIFSVFGVKSFRFDSSNVCDDDKYKTQLKNCLSPVVEEYEVRY